MSTTILTLDDLQDFKRELLAELKTVFPSSNSGTQKKWLKSRDVRSMLGISPGTLQTLRINGTLPYTKIGGVIYYDHEEIQRILSANKIDNRIA